MFKELCGTDTYQNVVILTTFWDRVGSQQEGETRESELKLKFFQPLVQGGAKFMHHDRTSDSAQRVIDHIVTLVPVNVRITEEIRVEGKTLEQTAAGAVRREEVDLLIAQHKREIEGFQAEMDALKGSNSKLRQELAADKAEMEQKLAKWEEDKVNLQRGLETEKAERQKLQSTVDGQQQQYIKREQDYLMRSLEDERLSRQRLESVIDAERQMRESNDQARIRDLENRLDNARGTDCIIM